MTKNSRAENPPAPVEECYTLVFSPAQVNVLSAALGELPLKMAGATFEALRAQVRAQQDAKPAA